ncbi:MAG: hypothetical protein ACYS32_15080 [Planctomycetota bacterium]|jgi:hypothetical protein
MKAMNKNHLQTVLMTILLVLICSYSVISYELQASTNQDSSCKYFKIQVVDRQTGRGVPLVQLRTTNNIRYFTDSHGIVAFNEPGLMDMRVFFFVESHGYEFPKDGFGMQGTRLKTVPGASAIIKIDRLNIAERLYRVTGQGIYRDSILTEHPVPLQNPALNGQVIGQDSVYMCLYRGRLFWLWGDTGRPSYPLGNFSMSGAVSDLSDHGGLDPAIGINLKYFVDENGFSKKMCPLKEPGMVWADGLLTVKDNDGRQRMIARFDRLINMGDIRERGLLVFNDATKTFEPLVRPGGIDLLPFPASGHAFSVNVQSQKYHYFALPFPLTVRMRVRSEWNDVIDPNRYEVLTALKPKKSAEHSAQWLNLGNSEPPYRWLSFAQLAGDDSSEKNSVIEALKKEKQNVHLYDIESGKKIIPHGGTVYFNAYRQRWIAIFVQQFGESSFLGEVWYAEADTPVGPWAYARKIATHNKYSFYNPKHHPLFDQDDGRIIFFEGTYSFTFSGTAENATPRYDYNQIMYRLNLADPRLTLPVAAYQQSDKQNKINYLLRDGVEKAGKWDLIESIPFYAIEPAKAYEGLIPVYGHKIMGKKGLMTSLAVKSPNPSAKPLFYALPSTGSMNENSHIIPLYEYHHKNTEQHLYSVEAKLDKKGWTRMENPMCRVWKTPPPPLLLDSKAKPTAKY